MVPLVSRALGSADRCVLAEPIRTVFGRAGLSGSDDTRSVGSGAAANRSTAQPQHHPAWAPPSRASGRGATVVRRPSRPTWRLHARVLVQALCAPRGCVLHYGAPGPALDTK